MPRAPRLTKTLAAALLTSGLAAGLALSGCRLKHEASANRLVVASKNRIDTVDPGGAYTFGAMQLLSAIGDSLYAINASGQLEPRLAVALPQLSADGLTAQVQLRQGVRFHDGTPFNAAAMVFSLERFLAIGKLSYLLGDRVSAARAVGPYTIELTLKRPFSPLAELLSAVNLTPLSPSAYKNHRDRFLNDRFVGTGPYRLSFFPGQQQRLEPFGGIGDPNPPMAASTWCRSVIPPPSTAPCRAARWMCCSRPAWKSISKPPCIARRRRGNYGREAVRHWRLAT